MYPPRELATHDRVQARSDSQTPGPGHKPDKLYLHLCLKQLQTITITVKCWSRLTSVCCRLDSRLPT